jgi:hypothetical protein
LEAEVSTIKYLVIFCTVALIIILFVSLPLELPQASFFDMEQQSPAICWEKFKAEKCDADQPTSPLCKQLLKCSTTEDKPHSKFNNLEFNWEEIGLGAILLAFISRGRRLLQHFRRFMRRL